MLSLQRLLPVSLLLAILSTSAIASPLDCTDAKGSQKNVEEFQKLLDQADPPSLHSALHDYSPKKFRNGMFEKDRTAAEILHRDDACVASSIVALAKRQTNGTVTTTTPAQAPVSSTPAAGESPTTPTPVAPIATASNGADTSGPAGADSTTTPAAGNSLVTTTSTSTSPLFPGQSSSEAAGSSSPSTTSAPDSSPSPTNGQVITTTNADGITIVSTIGGGFRTLSPSGAEGSSTTSAPKQSESSHTTTRRSTSTLPNGSQSVVTAVTVVGASAADTAAPSGTAGVTGSGTGTAAPGLQTGVATRMGWGMEVLAVVGGAVGVAVMM